MKFCKISWKNEKKPGKMRISVHFSQEVFSLQNVIFFQMIRPLKITCIRHQVKGSTWVVVECCYTIRLLAKFSVGGHSSNGMWLSFQAALHEGSQLRRDW